MREHTRIFVGMGLGVVLGLLLSGATGEFAQSIVWLCDLFGTTIFIGALKMIVAPLIFFSILAGITSLAEKAELWSIGWRTLGSSS
jgi:Na+/H+-dicarboxylate symporter